MTPLVRVFSAIYDLIIPPRCVHCGKIGLFLCPNCLNSLSYLEASLCPVCTRPSIDGFTHPGCRTESNPDRLFCAFRFRGALATSLKKLKYQNRVTAIIPTLINLLIEEMKESDFQLGGEAIIIPVPLSAFRKFERGYNQSELLSGEVARGLGLRMESGYLERVRETKSQTKLKELDRQLNVRGAFAVPERYKTEIVGKDIIVFDDIFTTGATTRECTRVLKRAGARYVYIVTMAKD